MEENLWLAVGNRCLSKACDLLGKETVPTAATVETVEKLVGIAIAIDNLNLRWAAQTRYGEAVFRDSSSSRKKAKKSEIKVSCSGPALAKAVSQAIHGMPGASGESKRLRGQE